ncbi:MAG: GntR family transcriptional regulator [Chloroflexi bacterium]|nr:GntR family transcriptional regulator [Chloroflexota bacterium]
MVADSVYARLRAAILSAELRPNRRLVEDDLADWLRVSRTPVREALLRLEQEGLVERDRGWIVRERNPTETRALVECRLAIEGYAARLAAARISQASLAELTTLADAMEESGLSRLEFNRLNEEFHRLITLAADNPMLANLHAQTKMNYWNLSVPVVFTPDVDRQVHEHHRSLLVALAAGDGSTAEQIARRHVQLTMDIVLEAVGLQVERPAPPG